jgi:hypothetical protein
MRSQVKSQESLHLISWFQKWCDFYQPLGLSGLLCARVWGAALNTLHAYFRDAGRGCNVSLLPTKESAGGAYLSGCCQFLISPDSHDRWPHYERAAPATQAT